MEQSPSLETNSGSARQKLPKLHGIRRFTAVFTRAYL